MSFKAENAFIDAYDQAGRRARSITQGKPSPLRQSTSLEQLEENKQPESSICDSSPRTAIDVQNILAAIHRLQVRYRIQDISWISDINVNEKDDFKELKNAPGKPPKLQEQTPPILRKALDALASFCVSREDEVVAVGLEAWHAKKANQEWVRLLIATDNRVEEESKQQLRLIWKSIKDIASSFNGRSASSTEESKNPVEEFWQDTQELIGNFTIICLSFSFEGWKKDINSDISLLLAVPLDGFAKSHPFRTVRENIHYLYAAYTSPKASIGKPHTEDKNKWRQFVSCLAETQESIEVFMSSDPFIGPENHVYAHYFPSMESYMKKVPLYLDMVQHLQMAACSSECKGLLKRPFSLYALPAMNNTARDVPHTAKDWQCLLEKAASIERDKYELDPDVIARDMEYMAQEPVARDLPVHCELKLVLEAMQRPKSVYAYIGMSKLSCYGCYKFLDALNNIYGTKFGTRGCTMKARYPWQFPPGLLFGKQVADQTYRSLAWSWIWGYHGYRPKRRHFQPGSVHSVPSVAAGDDPTSPDPTTIKTKEGGNHWFNGSLACSVSKGLRRVSSLLVSRRDSV